MNYITLKELYEGLKPFVEKEPNCYITGSFMKTSIDGTYFIISCRDKNKHNSSFSISIPIEKGAKNND